jgi:diacylglycerol O-acyltransferase / wax synthase
MRSLYAYVPIASVLRVSIGIYSYLGDVTFGINADFDAFPDVDVLAEGIGRGMTELLDVADRADAVQGEARSSASSASSGAPARKAARSRRTATKRASSS